MINFADLRNSEQDLSSDNKSRQKHDYTCELELKSLLIREKNSKLAIQNNSIRTNKRINELINLFIIFRRTQHPNDKVIRVQTKRDKIDLSILFRRVPHPNIFMYGCKRGEI